jgi:hypothetical protein
LIRPATALFFAVASLTLPAAEAGAEDPLKIRGAALVGHDNNVNLDPGREGDQFAQETVSLGYRRLLGKTRNLRLEYDASNLNYSNVTDQNVLSQSAGAGLDFLLDRHTILQTDYSYSYSHYFNNDSVTHDYHRSRVGVRRRFGADFYAKAGAGFQSQEFDDRFLRQPDGNLSDEERRDGRFVADAELGVKLWDKTLWRFGYERIYNDSNDKFHDYYDYDASRYSIGGAVRFIPKVSSFVRFTYEDRGYSSRPLLDDDAVHQSDDIYTVSLACFYGLRKDVSLGALVTFREKASNEPTQSYAGSVSTLGIYCSF